MTAVDTNVLIHACDKGDPRHSRRGRAAARRRKRSRSARALSCTRPLATRTRGSPGESVWSRRRSASGGVGSSRSDSTACSMSRGLACRGRLAMSTWKP